MYIYDKCFSFVMLVWEESPSIKDWVDFAGYKLNKMKSDLDLKKFCQYNWVDVWTRWTSQATYKFITLAENDKLNFMICIRLIKKSLACLKFFFIK